MSRADFSRLRFNLKKHYRNVLSQQGRVWLDSDWNEESETRAWQDEERTLDLVGPSGVPAPYTAFRIGSPAANTVDFRIGGGPTSEGDFYVDGILCRNEIPTTYLTQPDFPGAPPLDVMADGLTTFALAYLEVWERLITHLEDEALREVALGGPDTAVRSKTVAQVKFLRLDTLMSCAEASTQLPTPLGRGTLTTLQSAQAPDPADICRLPQAVTFTGRENRLYRVEIHEQGDVIGGGRFTTRFTIALAQDAAAGALSIVLATPLTPASATRLREGGSVTLSDDDGRRESVFVTGVDNDTVTLRLGSALRTAFTVAANTSVTGGLARFKWSASNGSFAVGVKDISADRTKLTLTSLGRDAATALLDGDLVEISDDASELGIGRGHLTHLDGDPNPDELTVVLEDPLPASTFDLLRHVTLRRWDGEGFAASTFDEVTTPWMNLGDGVHIQFGGGDFRIAEYWQFATRVIDGSVEQLTDAPPQGIVRHRCPLAVVQWALGGESRLPAGEVRTDCRPRIPLLTRMIQMHYVGGDGQEALVGEQLPRPLQVGVTNGPFAMPGMSVRFFSTHPGGVVSAGVSSGQTVVTVTDSAGEAGCLWTPPPVAGTHIVVATLELTAEDEILCEPLRVIFNAKVDDPPVIEPVMVVKAVTDEAERMIENDQDMELDRFLSGINIFLDHPPHPDSIKRPTVFVSIEIPEQISDLDLGFYEVLLRADVKVSENLIMWRPDERVRERLGSYLQRLEQERYLVHLTMRGNFIWANDDRARFLDGDSFAEPGASPPIALRLPSGDTRRGGDFKMWFWVRPQRRQRKLVMNVINTRGVEAVSLAVRRPALQDAVGSTFNIDVNAPFDPARARALFANFGAGQQLRILTTPDLDGASRIIQLNLREAGLATDPQFLPLNRIVAVLATAQTSAFILLAEEDYQSIESQLPTVIREAVLKL